MKKNIYVSIVAVLLLAIIIVSCATAHGADEQLPVYEDSIQIEEVVEPVEAIGAVKVVTVQKVGTLPAPVKTVQTAEPAEQLTSLGTFKLTHYCACEKCCGKWALSRPLDENGQPIVYTASGTVAKQGRTIAVDTRVIPYGTEVLVRYADGTEQTFVAEDCGGAIKENRIDIYMESHQAALTAGVKTAEVFIVEGRA